MADILIRGMEMPENCFDCPIFDNFCQERCGVTGTLMHGEIDPQRETLTDCPLLPLPEGHGRLIDADEISGSLAESATFNYNKRTSVCWSDAFLSMIDMLDEAPTIVPAEGGTDDDGNA